MKNDIKGQRPDVKHLSTLAAILASSGSPGGSAWFAERALEIYESAEEAAVQKAGFDRDIERLEVAAAALLGTYPEGHEHAGAYIAAFESFVLVEQLDELSKALAPFRLCSDFIASLERVDP